MHDREKIVHQLEQTASFLQRFGFGGFENIQDAIAMLKEQEAVKRTSRTGNNGFSIIWTCGVCGSDLHPNNAKAKYCSNCGQAVKWE